LAVDYGIKNDVLAFRIEQQCPPFRYRDTCIDINAIYGFFAEITWTAVIDCLALFVCFLYQIVDDTVFQCSRKNIFIGMG